MVIVTVVIQLLENLLLVPRVMGKSVGVSPIVAMLALVTFASLLGLAGAVLAMPIAAVIQILLDRYVLKPGVFENPLPAGRDSLTALRMEIKELTLDIRKQVRDKEHQADPENDMVEDVIEEIAIELDRLLEQSPEEGQAS